MIHDLWATWTEQTNETNLQQTCLICHSFTFRWPQDSDLSLELIWLFLQHMNQVPLAKFCWEKNSGKNGSSCCENAWTDSQIMLPSPRFRGSVPAPDIYGEAKRKPSAVIVCPKRQKRQVCQNKISHMFPAKKNQTFGTFLSETGCSAQ